MHKKIEFYDIYDYIYVPFYKTKIFIIIYIILVLAAIAALTYFLIKLRKSRKPIKKITPWEKALKELKELKPQIYETKQEFKNFYFEITNIIKKYFQKRFKLDIMEKTDEEVINFLKTCDKKELKSHARRALIIEKLEEVLQGSLFIKFANAEALREQASTDLEKMISIVKQTKIEPLEKQKS